MFQQVSQVDSVLPADGRRPARLETGYRAAPRPVKKPGDAAATKGKHSGGLAVPSSLVTDEQRFQALLAPTPGSELPALSLPKGQATTRILPARCAPVTQATHSPAAERRKTVTHGASHVV